MIAVIADDFSGAAEVAGAAFAAGYAAEVQTEFDAETEADVVVVDTDTRSVGAREAASVVERTARRIADARPQGIFKKVDSLLRGNVAAEVEAVRRVFGKDRVILAPANPAAGRTVRAGRYLIGGDPLTASDLAQDPEHPRRSDTLAGLLGDTSGRLTTPDVTIVEDLERLARHMGRDVLPAGSAAFFEAVLQVSTADEVAGARTRALHQDSDAAWMEGRRLYVCGSRAAWRSGRREEAERHGVRVVRLPDDLIRDEERPDDVRTLAETLHSADGHVLLAIGRTETVAVAPPRRLAERLVDVACGAAGGFGTLYVEGGATAGLLVRRLGAARLRVIARPAPGVVTLRAVDADWIVTAKVGSYAWPASAWPDAPMRP